MYTSTLNDPAVRKFAELLEQERVKERGPMDPSPAFAAAIALMREECMLPPARARAQRSLVLALEAVTLSEDKS